MSRYTQEYMEELKKFVIGEEMKVKRTKGEKAKPKELGVGHLSEETKGQDVKAGERVYAGATIKKAQTIEELTTRLKEELGQSVEEMKRSPKPEDKNLANEGGAIERTLDRILQWAHEAEHRKRAEKELVGLGFKARQAVKEQNK